MEEMNLIEAVMSGSLKEVKKVVAAKDILFDDTWDDYNALCKAIRHRHEVIAWFLLDKNCRVNNSQKGIEPHDTPLHSAIRQNLIKMVIKLLEKNASITTLNAMGYSPLHLALIVNQTDIINVILDFMLKTKNFVNTKAKNRLSHMHVACTTKNVKVIQGFIKSGANLEDAVSKSASSWPGYTAFHFAVEFQSLEAVCVLVHQTTYVHRHKRDSNGDSALDLVKKNFENLSIMMYLLDGDHKNYSFLRKHMSNFHFACLQMNPELVQKFIQFGAAVNNPISYEANLCPGYTPLHCAVESNCKYNVELLLEHGGNIEAENKYSITPIHLALYNEDPKQENTIVDILFRSLTLENKLLNQMDINGLNYFHIAVTRNDLSLVKQFIAIGEDVNRQILHNERQFSYYAALHFAVRYGHLEMAKFLIEQGANFELLSLDGTPLQIAVANGERSHIAFFIENGAKADSTVDGNGKTLIHSLAKAYTDYRDTWGGIFGILRNVNENDDLLEYFEKFIQLGCHINAQNFDGNTALHIVCYQLRDGSTCVNLLLQLGADINLENNEGKTPFDCAFNDIHRYNAKTLMVLYHHVEILKKLRLKVSLKNEKCCQRLLDEKNTLSVSYDCFKEKAFAQEQKQRDEEIDKMKKTKLHGTSTLYSFLRTRKATGMAMGVLKEIVQDEELDTKYPSYAYLIKLSYQEALKQLDIPNKTVRQTRSTMKRKRH